MNLSSYVVRTASVSVLLIGLFTGAAQAAEKQGLVVQVSEDSPAVWNQALNNVMNVKNELGDDVQIEIVAYGPGLKMLKFDSEVNKRLTEASQKGVILAACGNTMTKTKVKKEDLVSEAIVVKAGVIEIMSKQKEGWAYLRP